MNRTLIQLLVWILVNWIIEKKRLNKFMISLNSNKRKLKRLINSTKRVLLKWIVNQNITSHNKILSRHEVHRKSHHHRRKASSKVKSNNFKSIALNYLSTQTFKLHQFLWNSWTPIIWFKKMILKLIRFLKAARKLIHTLL